MDTFLLIAQPLEFLITYIIVITQLSLYFKPRFSVLSLEQHINLIFVSGTGTAKTHLATAIAAQAIRDGKKCKFYNLVDLANELEEEKMAGFAGRISARLLRFDMVLLDELG